MWNSRPPSSIEWKPISGSSRRLVITFSTRCQFSRTSLLIARSTSRAESNALTYLQQPHHDSVSHRAREDCYLYPGHVRKAAWTAYEEENAPAGNHNATAVAQWDSAWSLTAEEDSPFHLKFAAPSIDILCETEAIIWFNIDEVTFGGDSSDESE